MLDVQDLFSYKILFSIFHLQFSKFSKLFSLCWKHGILENMFEFKYEIYLKSNFFSYKNTNVKVKWQ